MAKSKSFSGPYTPTEEDLAQCVRCGLCLQHCPTYVETGLETESPRGRLYLIKALAEGGADLTANATGHLDQCLQCRNCESVCPSGVPYGRIMEGARAEVLSGDGAPLSWKLRALFLRQVIAHPGRLSLFASFLRFLQASGLQSLAERLPVIRNRAVLAPRITGKRFRVTGVAASPSGAMRHRVALLSGCIMPHAFAGVHEATLRVLARNGCEVTVPANQACCGALHAHNGDRQTAVQLARRNVDAFLEGGFDAVIVNSAGCAAAMKEYSDLLHSDPDYRDRAARLSGMVKDIHEFLGETGFEPPSAGLAVAVTYQDPCHLAHAQRITAAPREVLNAIPGLRLLEMPHADRCCGSAGVYSLTQPRMALDVLDEKMESIESTGATLIATANPGCISQLQAGVRRRGLESRVVHVVELLDEAYRAESTP